MVPSRWRRTVQTMIEKEPGAPWIHRLRIIELFDAQANAGFQIFVGRNMMRHAVTNDWLSEESFGSTPGKMATSALVQKTLAIDQLRLERRAGGIFDCDASGCYDRILLPLASVHLQALGIQQSIGTFLARLMYFSRRYVKTSHGISKKNIRTTKRKVLYGIGQGNGGGPAMWISHLTVMFAALSSVCLGVVMTCVEGLTKIATVGTGYVDDVTLGLSIKKSQKQTERQVLLHLRRMSQLWETLLYITGGRLELSKCFWVPITWKWTNGKPTLVQKHNKCEALYLRESETKDMIKIPRKVGSDVEKRLGVYHSCDGRWTYEYNRWRKLSQEFGEKLKKAQLDRLGGYLAYHALWVAKFRYSAAVMGLTNYQLTQIQKKIIGPCLSVAGYSQKIPRAVVFGPEKYGGMDWVNIKVLSLYEKLKLLIGSVRLQDKVGQMIQIQLSWLQLFVGTSTKILQADRYIPYIPIGWMQNLHTHLVENRIKVEINNVWYPSKQREEDRVIMDIVCKKIPQWAWAGINRCRLFLEATTLADITTLGGRYIPENIRLVKGPLRRSVLEYPIQQKPSKTDIEQWKFLIDSISYNGLLFTQLGQWIRNGDQIYPFVMNIEATIVYKKVSVGWEVFGRSNNKVRHFKKLVLRIVTTPRDCRPVRVIEAARYLIVARDQEFGERASEYYRQQELNRFTHEEAIVGRYTWDEEQMDQFRQQWTDMECTVIAATDGGLKEGVGTSSYALFFPEVATPILQGHTGEYQPSRTASSTRQELRGQLGIEYWLARLARRWGIPRKTFTVILITDSKASIEILENAYNIVGIKDTLRPEMDVALEIVSQQISNFWVTRKVVKVESHISEENAPDPFDWKCNDIADKVATKAREIFVMEFLKNQRCTLFPGTRAGVLINGRLVNNDLYGTLKDTINGREMKMFLMAKYSWTEKTFDEIDWLEHYRQVRRYSLQKRVTLIKYLHGWLATNRRRYREGASHTHLCPLCSQEEHKSHMFICCNEKLRDIRQSLWRRLVGDLGKSTEPGFSHVFQSGLATAMGEDPPTEATKMEWPVQLQAAYEAQTTIGWDQVLAGRLYKKWDLLSEYNRVNAGEQLRTGWTGRAVRLCWEFGLELWTIRNGMIYGTGGNTSKAV